MSVLVHLVLFLSVLVMGCAQESPFPTLDQLAHTSPIFHHTPESLEAHRQAVLAINAASAARVKPVLPVPEPVTVWNPVAEARQAMYERHRLLNTLPEGTSYEEIADAEERRLQKEWQAMERRYAEQGTKKGR